VFYFSAEKDIRIFVFFSFFSTKMAVKKQKKKLSTLAEAMHGGQSVTSSRIQPLSASPPAEAVSTEQTHSAVSAAAVGLCQ